MKCNILHESPNRLRVHLHCARMSLHEADLLEYYLRSVDGVTEVTVYDRTQDAVVRYTGQRSAVIGAPSPSPRPRPWNWCRSTPPVL